MYLSACSNFLSFLSPIFSFSDPFIRAGDINNKALTPSCPYWSHFFNYIFSSFFFLSSKFGIGNSSKDTSYFEAPFCKCYNWKLIGITTTFKMKKWNMFDNFVITAVTCFTHTLKKPFLDISYLRKGNRSIFRADAAHQLMN